MPYLLEWPTIHATHLIAARAGLRTHRPAMRCLLFAAHMLTVAGLVLDRAPLTPSPCAAVSTCCSISCVARSAAAVPPASVTVKAKVQASPGKRRCPAPRCCEGDGPSQRDEEDPGDRLQRLLDSPVIDPSKRDANEPQLLSSFKDLVENDYPLAEALFAGCYFAILLFFAQQGVRIYKHCIAMPDSLCPWDAGSSVADPFLTM